MRVSRRGLISDSVSPRAIRFIARLHSARIAVYAGAVLLAPWLTIGSIAVFAAATIFYFLVCRILSWSGGWPNWD